MCVCCCERERECVRVCESVCVRERRESVSLCVCERVCESVCVCERV